MRAQLEVTVTTDGLAKAVTTCGLRSRSVWLGMNRRYRFEPIDGDDQRHERHKDKIGRTCVIVNLRLDAGANRVQVRWDDTGKRQTIDSRDLVQVHERTSKLHIVRGGGMAHSRALDRTDDNAIDRVDTKLEVAAPHADDDVAISKTERRADKRQLCELCQKVHVACRFHRTCRFCWEREGFPDRELLEERLNALAYERHVKGIPERWRR